MTREFTVAVAQMASNSETKARNIERLLGMVERAGAAGSDLLVFPECALTPFFPVQNRKDFEGYFNTLPDAETAPLLEAAQRAELWLVLPYAERTRVRYYNSAAMVSPAGEVVGQYRKSHIPGGFVNDQVQNFEKFYFTSGDLGFPVFDCGDVRVGIQICYDRNFPEGFRAQALAGAEVVVLPTAAGSYGKAWRSDTWELILRARAIENTYFVVGVNKIGPEYGQTYFGQSMVVNPLGGEVAARAEDTGEDELVITTLELDDMREARKRLCLLRDLRLDEYEKVYDSRRLA